MNPVTLGTDFGRTVSACFDSTGSVPVRFDVDGFDGFDFAPVFDDFLAFFPEAEGDGSSDSVYGFWILGFEDF